MKTKSPYLILLAATAVVVTCEPQRSNNDIIWYPVDEEEGVFISTYGEKHRTAPDAKWRSHRRARYSGVVPLSYDPSENYDPSFFHDIKERRPPSPVPPIPNFPPSFHNQLLTVTKRPQVQNVNENFQEIINEVFYYNKHPPASEYPVVKPETISDWSGGQNQVTGNQWGGSSGSSVSKYPVRRPTTNNQWINASGLSGHQFPGQTGNQWDGTSGSSLTQYPGNPWLTTSGSNNQRPATGSQWGNNPGNQWGTTSGLRPTNTEWTVTSGTSNRPRPSSESDKLVFPDEFPMRTTTTSTTMTPSAAIPPDTTTMSPCERLCPVTPEFNPVCGSDSTTYSNAGRLKCAQMCGKNVELAHHGNCGRTTLVTPLVSNNRKQKFRGPW